MKKSLVIPVITLSLINFASAYYGSYFSFSDLLNSIDPSTMILGAVFIISFAFINFALVRVFKDNKASAGIVAFVVSLLIIYGINKSGFDIEELFYGIGISSGFLYTILSLVLLAGVIYLIIKLKTKALFVIGGLFIIVSFTNLVYEKDAMIILGIILLVVGLYVDHKWPEKKQLKGWYYHP